VTSQDCLASQRLSLVAWECSERVPSRRFTCYTLYLYMTWLQTEDPRGGVVELGGWGGKLPCACSAESKIHLTWKESVSIVGVKIAWRIVFPCFDVCL
jgi:hypothetical protein